MLSAAALRSETEDFPDILGLALPDFVATLVRLLALAPRAPRDSAKDIVDMLERIEF